MLSSENKNNFTKDKEHSKFIINGNNHFINLDSKNAPFDITI